MQIKKNHILYGVLALTVLLGLFLIKPLFAPGIPMNVDLPCHYVRIWCIEQASSNVPNNWCPHQAGGLPSSQTYYPPLDFLIAMLGYIFGLDRIFKLFIVLSLFLPGIGAYWLLKKNNHDIAAVIAFVLLVLFPGSWQAGGFEETVMVGFWHYMSTIGFLLLSLTYYIELLKTGHKKSLFWALLFTVFIVHPFTILYAAILFATVTIYYYPQALKHWKTLAFFIALAVVLNAYYWIPLFAKLSYFPGTGNVAMTWHNVQAYLIGRIPWYVWATFFIGLAYLIWRRKEEHKTFLVLAGITLAYCLKELWISPFYSGDRVMVFASLWIFILLALFLQELIHVQLASKPKNIPLWPLAILFLLITGYSFYTSTSQLSENIFTSSHSAFDPQMKAFDPLKGPPQGRVVMEETLYNFGNYPQSLTHTECAIPPLSGGKEGMNFALAYFPRKTSVIHHDGAGNFFNKPIKSYTPQEIDHILNEFNIQYVIAHSQAYADVMSNHSTGYQLFNPIAVFKTNVPNTYFKTKANVTSEDYQGTYAKATVVAHESTSVTLKANAYPNWKTYVDGKSSKTEECDFFVCTTIPTGQHTVEFKYETIGVDYLGYFLSLLGLIGLIWTWKQSKHDPVLSLSETKETVKEKTKIKKKSTDHTEKRAKIKSTPFALSIKKEWLYLLILAIVLTGVFLYPALHNLDYLGIRDWGAMTIYPLVSRISLLTYHQVPLWNPYQCGGNLLFAHPHAALLSPFFLFVLLFNVMPGIKISFFAYYILGFLGSYYLAKKYGMEWRSALFVSILYTFTTTLANYMTEGYAHWGAQMLIPALFLFYLKSQDNIRYVLAASLTLSWIIFSGYYWGFVIMSTVLGVYTIFETLREKKARYLLVLGLIFLLTFLVCAIKLFPLLQYGQLYPKVDTEVRSAYTWSALYTALVDPNQGPYARQGPGGEWFNFSLYLGWLPLLFAIAGLVLYAKRHWPLALTGLIALWISFGNNAWINLYAVLKWIPAVTTSFHSPARFNTVFLLILCLFAGMALQRLLTAQIFKVGKATYMFTPQFIFQKKKDQTLLPEGLRTLICILFFLYLFLTQVGLSNPTLRVAFPAPPLTPSASPEFFQTEAPNFPNPYTGSQDLFGINQQGHGLVKKEQALASHAQNQLALPIYDSLYGNREYLHILANLGTTNCYSTFHIPPKVQPVYLGNGSQNPNYRGETYLLNGKGSAKITTFTPNRFVIQGTATEPDVLVLNQNHYGGWESDYGEVLNTGGLISVPVQPGNFSVTFVFSPGSFWIGLLVSLIGLAAMIYAFFRSARIGHWIEKNKLWKEYY